MRRSASWLLWVGLSLAACSDDDNGQSEESVEAADASTDEDMKSAGGSGGKKTSGSAGKAGSGSGGAGGSKSRSSSGSGEKAESSDAQGDDKKSDDAKESAPDGADGKPAEGEGDEGEAPASSEPAPAADTSGTESDTAETEPGKTEAPAAPATNGDQLAVCSMIEGDCNQGLACNAPAGPFSPGRGFCSKICQQDEDCAGLAPEGTKYTCSSGAGTNSCEIACSGAEDSSCPSAMACVQTGVRRRPAAASDAGVRDGAVESDAGSPWEAAFEPLFHCRHRFEVSKIWGACGDAAHVCGEGLRCASAFWFGGAGHCTRGCESDADCAKPESGNAQPSCLTLVPAFGETPAVKQCVLSCSADTDGCPSGLSCFQGRQTRSEMGSEPMPAFAYCQ